MFLAPHQLVCDRQPLDMAGAFVDLQARDVTRVALNHGDEAWCQAREGRDLVLCEGAGAGLDFARAMGCR